MTYVMSDLHGCYDLYRKMLEKIRFSQDDTLYIIGDAVDRSEHGIAILLDIMEKPNVKLLMGNHEYLMAVVLSNIELPINRFTVLTDQMQAALAMWLDDGGTPTFSEFVALPPEEQKRIVKFLVKLPLYAELSAAQQSYLLVHSGLDNFSVSRELGSYQASELLEHRHNLEQNYFADKTIIVGHTPTFFYGAQYSGRILRNKHVINIDCGCAYPQSGVLGCLRLEDSAEFYVQ